MKGLGGASAGYSVLDFELTHLDFLNLETWRSDGCCVTSYPRFGVFTLLDFAGALTQKEILILLGASKHAQCKKAGKAKKWFTYVSVSEVHEFCWEARRFFFRIVLRSGNLCCRLGKEPKTELWCFWVSHWKLARIQGFTIRDAYLQCGGTGGAHQFFFWCQGFLLMIWVKRLFIKWLMAHQHILQSIVNFQTQHECT